ncbi:MAG: TolC family protein, partial [Bacteroidota bacterium]|nr:TolC family protein [Bacteroidota bacterium]
MKMHFRYYFKPVRICIVVLTFAGIFTSCKVLQPHKYPDLSSDNKLFRELDVSDTSTIANIPWKQLFTDVHLQSLIQEALNNNQDLQIAVARVNKAEADLRQSNAAFFPSVTANAVGSATNSELPNQEVTRLYEVYGAASWEIDVWGKLRNTRKANMAAFLASDAYRRTVQTQLIANVAMTYYTLLAYDEQLKITQKTVEKRDSDVTAMTLLKNTDVVTGADLVLSQANRYAAEVTLPDLKQKIYETENALCLLLG